MSVIKGLQTLLKKEMMMTANKNFFSSDDHVPREPFKLICSKKCNKTRGQIMSSVEKNRELTERQECGRQKQKI